MKKIAIAATAVLALASLTACSEWDNKNGRGDAAITDVDDGSAEVVNFPDVYGNLATKCSHGHRLYSTTHGSSDDTTEYASQIWVIPNDPTCPKEAAPAVKGGVK